MNFENLKTMTQDQLVELHVRQLGRRPHHKAKPDTIIKAIVESALLPQVQPQETFKGEDMRPKALKGKEPEYVYTEADVREACKEAFAREGFTAEFPGDGTVIFRCRGAEDSLNLCQPMRNIKGRAGMVSRGRIALMGLNQHFDATNAGGKNAYTNTVLA